MDLCRANERNAAALTLTSIGQQSAGSTEATTTTAADGQDCVDMPSAGPVTGGGTADGVRMRSTAGTTWLLVDNNNAEHAATTVVAQQQETTLTGGETHPETNNNVSLAGTGTLNESWTKQPTVLEDGSIVYADVLNHSIDGILTQSM